MAMQDKLINNLIALCRKTAPVSQYQSPRVRQIGVRWLYLLRNAGFCLPGFEILTVMLTEDKTASESSIQLLPGQRNDRQINYLVPEIPDESDSVSLTKLANTAIWESLDSLCPDKQADDFKSLSRVQNLVTELGDDFPIVFRSLVSGRWTVELQLQPSGQFACGGVVYISIDDSETGTLMVRPFFEYFVFMNAVAICKHLKIRDNKLIITGSDLWKRLHRDMISEVTVSLPAFISSSAEESDWLETDVSKLRERLSEPTEKHPLLQGIDLSIFIPKQPG